MTKENLFFDLDGTIIDSSEGIFNSLRYVIKTHNLFMPDEKTLNTFIGPPLHSSFERIFKVDFKTSDEFVKTYREWYSSKGVMEFSLYEGLQEVFKNLSSKYTLFVTTSKPTHYAIDILKKADVFKYFKEISGSEKDKPDNSKQQVVDYVIDKYNLDKNTCALIGDTKFDGEGAKLCEIDFYGVTYGFGTKEELLKFNPVKLFDTTKDIENYFMK